MIDTSKIHSSSRTVLSWILLGLLFLVPLFFLPFTFVSTQFATSFVFALCVLVAMLVYIVSGVTAGFFELPKNTKLVFVCLGIVPLVYILAGIGNGFSRLPFLGYTLDVGTVGFIILAFLFLFLVSISFQNKKSIAHQNVY